MATLRSTYDSKMKHRYTFAWSERAKWLAMLTRFHRNQSRWEVSMGPAICDCPISNSVARATEQLEALSSRVQPMPTQRVTAYVRGTAFWGAMPTNINWAALPPNPPGDIPAAVQVLMDRVDLLADCVGCTEDTVPVLQPLADAADPAWFPAILRMMHSSPSYETQTLFYAPSVAAMYVQVANARGDPLIVRFDSWGARLAADEDFDLDDGFGPGAPAEMHHDFVSWCLDTNLDPRAELLQLRAPYDAMLKSLTD